MKPIIMLGVQGSGKGTQAKVLCKEFDIVYIETGSLLRRHLEEKTKYASDIEPILYGNYVRDDIVCEIIGEEITNTINSGKNFLIDGFPRSKEQAAYLKTLIGHATVIDLVVPDRAAIDRLLTRKSCNSCGTSFNSDTPCPSCGGVEFSRRDDDYLEAIQNRIAKHHSSSEEVFTELENTGADFRVYSVRAEGEKDVITRAIKKVLKSDNGEEGHDSLMVFNFKQGPSTSYVGASFINRGSFIFVTTAGLETSRIRIDSLDHIVISNVIFGSIPVETYLRFNNGTSLESGKYEVLSRPDWDKLLFIKQPDCILVVPTSNVDLIQSQSRIK